MAPAKDAGATDDPQGGHRGALVAAAGVVGLVLVVAALLTPVLDPVGPSASPSATASRSLTSLGYSTASTAFGPSSTGALDAPETLLIIAGPASPYTTTEAGAVMQLLDDGGRLLILDGSGNTRRILDRLSVRTDVRPVVQVGVGAEDGATVDATVVVSGQPFAVRMNGPAPILDPDDPDTPHWESIALTGNRSFIDLNGDQRLDGGDTRGPFVVGAKMRDGRAVVLTDDRFLTDEGLAEQDGLAAFEALVRELLPDGGTVVFDTSHAQRSALGAPPVAAARTATDLARIPLAGILFAAGAAFLAIVASRLVIDRPLDWFDHDHEPENVLSGRSHAVDADRMLAALGQDPAPGSSAARARSRDRQRLEEALRSLTDQREAQT